ncbi:hypothetical protein OE88DRAFT_1657377 [Heliocybe sulcata]|uniref:Uncharacterized protein n=1 Tax=Heliocybe sulcata TaxID=5364 RepID=A0A5C3N6W9_9AGAM|nr:hypothetical protein OE88DRAFT_1657377 [Heliocybe sulcata]
MTRLQCLRTADALRGSFRCRTLQFSNVSFLLACDCRRAATLVLQCFLRHELMPRAINSLPRVVTETAELFHRRVSVFWSALEQSSLHALDIVSSVLLLLARGHGPISMAPALCICDQALPAPQGEAITRVL